MNYNCSECGKPIGLIANKNGEPVPFKCHRYGVAEVQQPIKRDTPPLNPMLYEKNEKHARKARKAKAVE